jgi:hypothetical protein
MAKSQKPPGKQPLLSQVPKRGRAYIATIMDERDGNLPLQQFLGKRWDHETIEKSLGLSPKELAQRQAESAAQIAQAHPQWSDQDIRTALSFGYLTMDLREAAIARRFTLDDPAELARGLAVNSRLRWIEMLIAGEPYVDFDYFIEALAVRDLPAAHHLAEGIMPRIAGDLGFLDLCPYAVRAAYRKGFAELRKVIQRMRKEKLHPWKEGICTCLSGLADKDPAQIAQGLTHYIDATRAMRMKDELEDAIELRAHGLYRLCAWISPELVAGVDVAQSLPWDAGFHAWSEAHPDPLADVDLTGKSPVLHQAVVLLQLPAGWTAPSSE